MLHSSQLQAQILVFCLQPLIVSVGLQQSWNHAWRLSPLEVKRLLLHALEISHVIKCAGRIETSVCSLKFLLELTSILIILANGVIDVAKGLVQVVVLIFYPVNPAHG